MICRCAFLLCLIAMFAVQPADSWAVNYYVDPALGDNAYNGMSPAYKCGVRGPKRTIGSLVSLVRPGDTVHLRGGIYDNDQAWFTNASIGYDGTSGNPITIKRYQNEAPIFKSAGAWGVVFTLARDWVVLDGIVFDTCTGSTIIILLEGKYNIIRNCTVLNTTTFIRLDRGSFNLIEYNTATNIGDNAGGQGGGEFVFIRGGENNTVNANVINGSGHAAIMLTDYPNWVKLSRYNKMTNNVIDQTNGGGGIYIARRSEYNLIEGNTIRNVGQMQGITQNKAGIYIAAPNNSARKNIILNYGVSGSDEHRGIMLAGTSSMDNPYCTNNFVYNNYVYAGYGLSLYYREFGSRASGYYVRDNVFANNIIYNSPTVKITHENYIGIYTPSERYAYYLGSYTDGAWNPFFGGNTFPNNLIYHANGQNYVAYFFGSGGWAKTPSQAQQDFPAVFMNTLETDPLISDVDTGVPAVNSPAIDSGTEVNDTNGAVGGWVNLTHCGSAPDRGAHERCI